jgi:hypothetical protein
VEIDHVLIAVAGLSAAAQEMEKRDGLASVEGGRHTASGTANGIVPLGKTYLELVAVVDATEARCRGVIRVRASARVRRGRLEGVF